MTTVEGTAEEIGAELTTQQTTGDLAVIPDVQAGDLVSRLDVIRDAMSRAMDKDIDYGVIPGTGSKPTLLKPGAEKLGVLFKLDIQITSTETYGPGDHLTVKSEATVFHAPTGTRLGAGKGICTTREKKYSKRRGERVCPTCGKPAIIKGKAEYGGGWVCFKKKDGCGAKFPDDDSSITGQVTGDVENPNLPDEWNTVLKMSEKRARIDAVLAVTGASAIFTQDMEDSGEAPVVAPVTPPAGLADENTPAIPVEAPEPITDRQRDNLLQLAQERGLNEPALANVLLEATGSPRIEEFQNVQAWLDNALARFPKSCLEDARARVRGWAAIV